MSSGRAPLIKWSPATWQRWSAMPRLSTTPVRKAKFLLLKAPVSTLYETKYGDRNVFTVPMYVQRLIAKNIAVGLVIDCTSLDLTSFEKSASTTSASGSAATATSAASSSGSSDQTVRYFHKIDEWDEFGIDYYRLSQKGQASSSSSSSTIPSAETIQEFINVCAQHWKDNPTMHIAIFDSRGSNGIASFLTAYYLCHKWKAPVHTALALVENASPHSKYEQKGLYDIELIKELQRNFRGKKEITVDFSKVPDWWFGNIGDTSNEKNPENPTGEENGEKSELSSQEGDGGDRRIVTIPAYDIGQGDGKRQHNQLGKTSEGGNSSSSKKSKTVANSGADDINSNLPMQKLPSTSQRYGRAIAVLQQLTNQKATKCIPIRQETKITLDNISQLETDKHKVTWRPVGRRGLLLILSDGIYFMENTAGDNNETSTSTAVSVLTTPLYIPNPQKPSAVQHRTLLHVTLVMDREKGRDVPRFFVSDILCHMGGVLLHKPFSQRLKYMMDGVIIARKKTTNIWKYEKEGIKMRALEYFDTGKTKFVKDEVMKAQLHDADGVIFLPTDGRYSNDHSFVGDTSSEAVMEKIIAHLKA